MFDSHCHLNFQAFADDAPAVANAMARNRVAGLVVGCDRFSSQAAIDLAQTFPNLWATVGLHPIHVLDDPWDGRLMHELALAERVVAIGEVGLDLYRFPDTVAKEVYLEAQYVTFEAAVRLAELVAKPLVIHSRAAYTELIDELRRLRPTDGGTIHCFMGDWPQAKALLDLGFHLGFTGVITYNDVAAELTEAATKVPADRLLIETDAPYLTPEPYRHEGKKANGKVPRNLPQYTLEVAKRLAEWRGQKMMAVVQSTEANAQRLFKLPADLFGGDLPAAHTE